LVITILQRESGRRCWRGPCSKTLRTELPKISGFKTFPQSGSENATNDESFWNNSCGHMTARNTNTRVLNQIFLEYFGTLFQTMSKYFKKFLIQIKI